MVVFKQKGSFRRTDNFFNRVINLRFIDKLDAYCKKGVDMLRVNTPVDSGMTASSWDYEIVREKGKVSIFWTNSNINKGVPIAVILQYGHGTRNGGWVEGRDYINPAIRPIFDEIAEGAWKEVTG